MRVRSPFKCLWESPTLSAGLVSAFVFGWGVVVVGIRGVLEGEKQDQGIVPDRDEKERRLSRTRCGSPLTTAVLAGVHLRKWGWGHPLTAVWKPWMVFKLDGGFQALEGH